MIQSDLIGDYKKINGNDLFVTYMTVSYSMKAKPILVLAQATT